MNFDPRRAAGNQALLFSCGGRADGGGAVTNSQLFTFQAGSTSTSLASVGEKGTCFTIAGDLLDGAACAAGDDSQTFTFEAAEATNSGVPAAPALSTTAQPIGSSTTTIEKPIATEITPVETGACISTSIVTSTTVVTRFVDVTGNPPPATEVPAVQDPAPPSVDSSSAAPAITGAPTTVPASENPTSPVPVSRAGGVLHPSAAAESNKRDDTATRALTGTQIKDATGKCLFVDPTAGDFRQNLIPLAVQDCTGSAGEMFDFITKGIHVSVLSSWPLEHY